MESGHSFIGGPVTHQKKALIVAYSESNAQTYNIRIEAKLCWFFLIGTAFAQSFGTSVVINEYSEDDLSAINVSIAAANGDAWVAVEYADPQIMDPALHLYWWDGSGWSHKQLSANRLTSNAMPGGLMYPSITTWPGEDYVYVTAKQDQSPAGVPQYEFYRQDRDNLAASANVTDLGTVSGTTVHQRPFLSYDYQYAGTASELMYLCWTQSTTTDTQEDARHKAKESTETWGDSSTATYVSADTNDDDDHCTEDFNHDGYVFSAYHSEKNSGDDIFVELSYVGGNFFIIPMDHGGELTLPIGSGADFPTISIRPQSGSNSRGFVVAKSLSDPTYLIWWTCEGDTSDCNEASEWVGDYQDLTGTVSQPNVVVTEYGHVFIVAENTTNDKIAVYEWCNGDTEWSIAGEIPIPVTHENPLRFGSIAGNAAPVVAWDDSSETLHAVFLAQPVGSNLFDPIRWRGTLADNLCQ